MKKLVSLLSGVLLSVSLHASSYQSDADFYKQIEQFFNAPRFATPSFEKVFSNYPKMDMMENKNSYILKFALAGMDKKNIKVTLSDDNLLSVSGTQDEYKKEDRDGIIKQERHLGSFHRSMLLPKDIARDTIDVKYENGVLTITIDKDMKKVEKNRVKVLPIN